jgi:polyisoprenoid-binding protein YceI
MKHPLRTVWLGTAVYLALPGVPIADTVTPVAPRAEYKIDGKTSRLTVETETVGLASMFGHDHRFVVRDFDGTITLDRGTPESAALELTVRADTLTLIEDASEEAHREIAAALRDAVLEAARYPQIVFRSRGLKAKKKADGSFDVKLAGVLDLHGVRRKLTVPAHVTLLPDGVRAVGALELRQSDFKIKPYTFAKGTVKVRDWVALSFDLVGRR